MGEDERVRAIWRAVRRVVSDYTYDNDLEIEVSAERGEITIPLGQDRFYIDQGKIVVTVRREK